MIGYPSLDPERYSHYVLIRAILLYERLLRILEGTWQVWVFEKRRDRNCRGR